MRLTIRRLAPFAVAACALMLPAGASASSSPKQLKAATNKGVAYLVSVQSGRGI
jgi:hypothetical protein